MHKTALMKAIDAGDVDRCRSLIRNGADVNAGVVHAYAEWRAIHLACQHGHLPIARLLVEAGATLTGGPTEPFDLAAICGAVDVCQLLVDAGVDPHRKSDNGFTAFTHACATGQLPTVEYLLEKGADVNFGMPDGTTVLMHAVEFDRVDVVRLLVKAGADTCLAHPSSDSPPLTPFQAAVRFEALRVMEYFLTELGEDPAQRTVFGATLNQLTHRGGPAQQLLASVRAERSIGDAVRAAGALGGAPRAIRSMAPSPL